MLGWFGRANAKLLLERALLLTTRLPSRTQIVKIDCPAKIAAGDDLNIEVQAGGVIPQSGTIYAKDGGHSSQYKLDAEGNGKFHAVIHSLPESLRFTVQLGDAESDPISVSVFNPPAVLSVACLQHFPDYTRLSPVRRPTGDLSLLAGSKLDLDVTATGPVKAGSIHLAGLEKDQPLLTDPQKPQILHGQIQVPKEGLTGFSLKLVDDNGIASRETAVYPASTPSRTVRPPSRSPTRAIMRSPRPTPPRSSPSTPEDDFGVSTVLLHYMVNDSAEKTIQFEMGAGQVSTRIDRRFDWKMSSLKLAPGGVLTYYLEAVDGNNITGPGRTTTDKATIKIVTDDEKRTELAGRMNDALGTLDEVSQSEDNLSQKLGTQIFQKPQEKKP